MQKAVVTIALLALVGLFAVPASAADLKVTGFIDNVVQTEQNISVPESNLGDNRDHATFGSTRARFFFNFIASDDLRGVWAMEFDSAWGAPARDRLGSRCVTAEQCGFRNNIDINNFELKNLYVDFRIPQLPIGNRWRVGGIPADVTPLHSSLLYTMDAGGADVKLNFTPEISLLVTYVQLEENVESYPGSVKIGEDYITGGTLMLKPLPGLDLHLLTVYASLTAPWGQSMTNAGGPWPNRTSDTLNVTSEARYYLGLDSRYRLGNLSFEPTFFYLLGRRNFCTPGTTIPGSINQSGDGGISFTTIVGAPVTCTSATAAQHGVNQIDYDAYEARVIFNYTLGRWLLSGKFSYATGDKATADLNNQGLTNGRTRDDIKGFRPLGIDTSNALGDWLDILGRGELLSGRTELSPQRMGEGGSLNRFGYWSLAGKGEYKLTDSMLLRGIVGWVWTTETPGCPAVDRTNPTGPTASNPTACSAAATAPFAVNSAGSITGAGRDWIGNSRFLGTELDAHFQWTIMPGLVNIVGGGYSFNGKGWAIQGIPGVSVTNAGKVQDSWIAVDRLLYAF